ncbi:MAG TPA: flippase-like domain-containing protein [Caldilineae bacterium]|nr:flippase-like domain-containing protein [Caldilineae bacterium]
MDHRPHPDPASTSIWNETLSRTAGQVLKAGRLWLGLGLSGGAIYLALRQVDISLVRQTMGTIRPSWAGLAVFSVILTAGVKAIRWRALYPATNGRPRLSALVPALLAGMMVNLLLPARLGEIVRIYAVERLEGESKALSLGTIALEKWADLLMLFVMFAGLMLVMDWPEWLATWGRSLAMITVVVTVLLIGALGFLDRPPGIIQRCMRRWPAHWRDRIVQGWEAIYRGLLTLRSRRQMGTLIAWTLVTWAIAAVTNLLVLRALDLTASLVVAMAVLVILQAGSAVPSSPAKIGVFHYLAMMGLVLFGIPQESALAFAIWLHLLVVGVLILLGIVSMTWITLRDPSRAAS